MSLWDRSDKTVEQKKQIILNYLQVNKAAKSITIAWDLYSDLKMGATETSFFLNQMTELTCDTETGQYSLVSTEKQ